MLIEAFRLHKSDLKLCAEIEQYNNDAFIIHPAFIKRPMEVDLKRYIARPKYKMARDGWVTKAVHELVDVVDEYAPSLFIRRPLYLSLVEQGLLSIA